MKEAFFAIVLLVLSAFIKAQLIAGTDNHATDARFTGGNYVFVEQGKLTFNLDVTLFENRKWSFDTAKDQAQTEFAVKLPLKTRHASEFHGYEISKIEANNMRVVVLNNFGHTMLVRPVYKKNLQGRYVKTWLPAAAGWVMRVGGTIARNILPPIIMRCFTNDGCKSVLFGLGINIPILCAFFGKTFPGTICDRVEKEGFTKNPQTQEYEKTYPMKVVISYGRKDTPDYRQEEFGANDLKDGKEKIAQRCKAMIGKEYNNQSGDTWNGLQGTIIRANLHENSPVSFSCQTVASDGEEFPGLGFSASIQESRHTERLTIVDITRWEHSAFQPKQKQEIV